jgi:hypothetical protein
MCYFLQLDVYNYLKIKFIGKRKPSRKKKSQPIHEVLLLVSHSQNRAECRYESLSVGSWPSFLFHCMRLSHEQQPAVVGRTAPAVSGSSTTHPRNGD